MIHVRMADAEGKRREKKHIWSVPEGFLVPGGFCERQAGCMRLKCKAEGGKQLMSS